MSKRDHPARHASPPPGHESYGPGPPQRDPHPPDVLQASPGRLHSVFDHVYDAIIVHRTDGSIIEVNQRMLSLYGLTLEQALQARIIEDLSGAGNSVDRLRQIWQQVLADQPQLFEWNARRPGDGAEFPVEVYLRRMDLPDGPAIVATVRDITERKQAEAERERLAQQRQLALDAARLGWWSYHFLAEVLSIDQRHADILGIAAGPHTKNDILARIHPEDRDRVWQHVQASLNPVDPHPYEVEFRLLRPDGAVRWVRAHAITTFEGYGLDRRATTLVGSVEDITERKASEEALRQANLRLEMAQKAAGAGVWDWDFITDRMDWSPQMFELFGLDPSQATASLATWQAVLHPDDRLPTTARVNAAMSERRNLDLEYRIVRPDGQVRWINALGQGVYDSAGRAIRMRGICIDITRRKQAEENLRRFTETLEQQVAQRTAEAEQRAAQLRALAAGLARAEEQERRRLAQLLHDHLQQILVAAKMRMTGLGNRMRDEELRQEIAEINELLAESIQESRSLTAQLSPPILYEGGLAAALRWLGPQMAEKHRLHVSVDAQDNIQSMSGDLRVVLFQAARELLFNVVKHAGVDHASVHLTRLDNSVRLVVEDAGRGLDPNVANQPHLSGRFGLLGLRERVQLMGGTMTLESAPGQGTRVTVEVPLERPEVAAPSVFVTEPPAVLAPRPRPTLPSAARPIRVVLADDHQIVREGLIGLLAAAEDIEVVGQAADGQQAFEAAQLLRPDVVVMDVNMPRLGGVAATRLIVSQLPDVKVVGLSMHEEDTAGPAIKEAGAKSYVRKDAPTEHLLAAIRASVQDDAPRETRDRVGNL